MAKKWPEKVVQRSFIKEHSFPNSLYVGISVYYLIFHINLLDKIRLNVIYADFDSQLVIMGLLPKYLIFAVSMIF